MKISNFEKINDVNIGGLTDYLAVAEVDVERGLFFKKTIRETICKRNREPYWYFAETGKIIYGDKVSVAIRIAASKKAIREAKTGGL